MSQADLKKLPLNDEHIKLGGKMVPLLDGICQYNILES